MSMRDAKRRTLFGLALTVLCALLVPAAAGAATKTVAKKGTLTASGKSVLTTNAGRTLYSLSAEKHGKFICTTSCVSTWKPLLVPAGTRPKGPVALGTVERPEGKTQVTYKGRPLYTFGGDSRKGEDNGEGIKDVGTWHAATLAGSAGGSEEPAPSNPYPYTPPEATPPATNPPPASPPSSPPAEPEPPRYPY